MGALFSVLAAAAFGAYFTLWQNDRFEKERRATDALVDVYFSPKENWDGLSPIEVQYRQSLAREKLAIFASPEMLVKLDKQLQGRPCERGAFSDECIELTAQELLIQRETQVGGLDGHSDAFLRIIRRELSQQRNLALPNVRRQFWLVWPNDIQFKADELERAQSDQMPPAFVQAFPLWKYTVFVQLDAMQSKGLRRGDAFVCYGKAGVAYQSPQFKTPSVPNFNYSVFLHRKYMSASTRKDCLLDAANRAVEGLFAIPVEDLKKTID